ncbi:MAG: hypothetical protein H6R18_1888 [Proteobacteria bacterium]|nr:hypothetical protein [Pseudomonadota bacterium]
MPFTPDLIDEMNTLLRFDLDTAHTGLKIHSTADAALITTSERLHAKGLLTQVDGGYLTSLGREAADKAQRLLSILTTAPALAKPPV